MTARFKVSTVTLTPVKLPRVRAGEDLNRALSDAIYQGKVNLADGDILAVASKVVSISENRIVRLDTVKPSASAKRLAKRWSLDARLAQLVLNEAEAILGGVRGFLLTIKNGILAANAGIDLKNCPRGTAALWPEDPDTSARSIRRILEKRFRVNLGVEIVDSRVTPMRLGTVGLAIGISGFAAIRDERKKRDLYGRRVRVTQFNLADDIAAAAHLLMGETRERIGVVVLRNVPVSTSTTGNSSQAKMKPERCLISSNLGRRFEPTICF